VKILMTVDTVGGVWTYAMELTRWLAKAGTQVALATMGRNLSREQHKQVSAIPGAFLFESEYKLEWMREPWDDVEQAGAWLLEIEGQFTPDVIHINGYALAALPWRAPKIVVAHSCVYSWWKAVWGTAPPDEEWKRYREMISCGLEAADIVVAPTRAMLRTLSENYSSDTESAVIYNGRSARAFHARIPKESFICSAGRLWDKAKNTDQLRRVSESVSWPVYVAGPHLGPESLNEFRASPNCVCLGELTQPNLANLLRRAAVFCAPAKYEPFGLAILEAAQAGCALVLGDIPSLRELWDGAAIFVDPQDDAGLAAELQQLVNNSARLRKFGASARTRSREFTTRKMGENYLTLYSRILHQPDQIVCSEVVSCES
jgi:glycogen(starch) synthase